MSFLCFPFPYPDYACLLSHSGQPTTQILSQVGLSFSFPFCHSNVSPSLILMMLIAPLLPHPGQPNTQILCQIGLSFIPHPFIFIFIFSRSGQPDTLSVVLRQV